ncbi:MAG: hypothetical protein J6K66_00565 [Clostridia bacterium]|nr:hypothetical protein [Clostridia bacterium]
MKKISERRHTVLVILIIIAAVGIPIVLKETVLAYFFNIKAFSILYFMFFLLIYTSIYCIYQNYNYRKFINDEQAFRDIISKCCLINDSDIFNKKTNAEIERKYSFDFSYKTEEYNKYGNLNETEVIETILEQFRLDLSQKFLDRKILLYYYNWKDFSVEDCCLFLLSSFLEEHSCDHKFCDHKMLKYAETKDYEEGAHNTVYQLTEFANIYYKLYYRVGLLCENNEKIKELTVSANKIKETLDKQRIYKTV